MAGRMISNKSKSHNFSLPKMSESCFHLVPSRKDGRLTAVASRDIMPGEVILVDKKPLMIIHPYRGSNVEIYENFMALPQAKKDKYLALHGPINDAMYKVAKGSFAKSQPHLSAAVVDQEFPKLFQICNIYSFNAFAHPSRRGHQVLCDVPSRFSHSCLPNCVRSWSPSAGDNTVIIRALLPIKAGDKLTVTYPYAIDGCALNTQPTHVRRHHYLLKKNFTCTCPRCAASGDDTRMFMCFDRDSKCSGKHLVCQPINQEPFYDLDGKLVDLHYTGVEFVEPHLLPCTVCGRSPPLDYEVKMFVLEQKLPALVKEVVACQKVMEVNAYADEDLFDEDDDSCARIMQKMRPYHTHMSHFGARKATMAFISAHFVALLHTPEEPDEEKGAKGAANSHMIINWVMPLFIHMYETVLSFPNEESITMYQQLIGTLTRSPLFGLDAEGNTTAVTYLRKTLQMQALLYGREERKQELDAALVKVLTTIQPVTVVESEQGMCAFCGESPERAKFALKMCGKCGAVAYCSVGCQKAHWKIHKKGCNKL